ncbi:Flavinator of succinate dehydrogenase-domain-containing protein [Biscogniauxia mediterranea]|nr:Flavinator of succinate dehydrogenase-domain-containing protein [Biscogniauxia mediterranea]
MTPLVPRSIAMLLRPAQRACTSRPIFLRALTTTSGLRASGIGPDGGNAPPMEPHKQRMRAPGPDSKDLDVGELEGASFRVEPLRRVGEDDSTMRARLTYQSRKRGTLESDLLLSTFADTYLPTMTREQMAQYDLFLDENDWDIYYWATQEPPPTSTSSAAAPSASSNTARPPPPPTMTEDTNSPAYGSAPEAMTAETSSETSTGGQAHDADALESKGSNAAAATAATSEEEPYRKPGEGEWAQTVGTFKPAYRPVPARWRDSEVLRLLREHVKAKARERGGMAFMPRLRV